jgi:hypothetical protein
VLAGSVSRARDEGLVTFAADGTPIASSRLSSQARRALGFDAAPLLVGIQDAQRQRLAWHRSHIFQGEPGSTA